MYGEVFYKILGVLTVIFLIMAVTLSMILFFTKRTKREVYLGSYTVLALLLILTFFCIIIHMHYH